MKPPKRGSIVKLKFDPQVGHEQAGYRPALVISNSRYNAATGLMVACPITNQAKGYPLEVLLPLELQTQGVVLTNQIKAMDWQARGFNMVEEVPSELMDEVLEKIIGLLEE